MQRKIAFLTLLITFLVLWGCGGDSTKKKGSDTDQKKKEVTKPEKKVKASERIDLSNKGIGPIKTIALGDEINQAMSDKGAEVFNKMCTACHKIGKKFIGPAPDGILKRRSPEWIMNMILNPDEMVKEDMLAKDLLIEFNGSPMANQNLTEEEARAVLEFFRTLK